MIQEEMDELEFEEIFEMERGYFNNIPNRHDLAKYFFMEGRRLLKEGESHNG